MKSKATNLTLSSKLQYKYWLVIHGLKCFLSRRFQGYTFYCQYCEATVYAYERTARRNYLNCNFT